jgi:hypothetical protein
MSERYQEVTVAKGFVTETVDPSTYSLACRKPSCVHCSDKFVVGRGIAVEAGPPVTIFFRTCLFHLWFLDWLSS